MFDYFNGSHRRTLICVALSLLASTRLPAQTTAEGVLPFPEINDVQPITDEEMTAVYERVKTPFKYGVVLQRDEEAGQSIDCPNIFRHGDHWYMLYVSIRNKIGYETMIARSDDLLHWEKLGTVLPFGEEGWDKWQADGSLALVDPEWGGSYALQPFDGRYWMTYFGGAKQGYETDPLSLGIAWTDEPTGSEPWTRYQHNPVMQPSDPDARAFEQATLYKSHVLWDKDESLGYPFVMYYNGKQKGPATERIGMAVSNDMLHWQRMGDGPVIDNGKGISGDPQIVRMDDKWVMFLFGLGWGPGAFDSFYVSRDLIRWRKWDGEVLVQPSEPWDKTFAHKPWVIYHDGIVYHFYCSVGKGGRQIALATSKDLGSSDE